MQKKKKKKLIWTKNLDLACMKIHFHFLTVGGTYEKAEMQRYTREACATF